MQTNILHKRKAIIMASLLLQSYAAVKDITNVKLDTL